MHYLDLRDPQARMGTTLSNEFVLVTGMTGSVLTRFTLPWFPWYLFTFLTLFDRAEMKWPPHGSPH